ncbi:uncharacterized protein LOC117605732 isoform X1 [Osmia lignaria lignaria]|uniref:uncharacterized protein LOC117605732 isoform X1 n=1 Tax=Osmia lignaria lignaria TaxID=1437193 RepID=UPI00147886A6|nr:gustatory receptor for bitter taste 66a-like isoform X1 [Osmia lignaria]
MKLFHPSNVYEESWLLLAITKLLGLYPVKFFKYLFLNYIYQIVLLIIYFVLFFEVHKYASDMFKTLISINTTITVKRIRYYTSTISLPLIMILSIRQSSKLRRVFKQIDNVDKNMKFFNTEIDYLLCMRNDVLLLINTILITILFNLMDYYGFVDNDSNYMYVLMWIVEHIPDFINSIILCSFVILIDKIRFRFKEINMILNIITKGKSLGSISESSDVNNVSRFKLLKVLRFKLRKAVSLLNEIYEFRFRILTMMYIVYVCLHISIIYYESNDSVHAIDTVLSLLWGILDLTKLVCMIHIHQVLTVEYA